MPHPHPSQIPDQPNAIREGRIEAAAGRIAWSDDPVCRDAIAFTLRYAAYAITERRQGPIIERQARLVGSGESSR